MKNDALETVLDGDTSKNKETQKGITSEELSQLARILPVDNMNEIAKKYLQVTNSPLGYNIAILEFWRKQAGENAKQVKYFFQMHQCLETKM